MLTNKEFSEKDETFKQACQKAGLPNHKTIIHKKGSTSSQGGVTALTRQASKWRRKIGLAWQNRPI